jgi:hypothetical protein
VILYSITSACVPNRLSFGLAPFLHFQIILIVFLYDIGERVLVAFLSVVDELGGRIKPVQ